MMRLAIISDLHANLTATLAVHADIQRRNIDEIWVLGDLVGKGPRPREVVEWTQEYATRVIHGNWDVRVAGKTNRPQDLWPRSKLTSKQLDYLAHLPFGIEEKLGGLWWHFVHASGQDVFQRLYPHSRLEDQLESYKPNKQWGLKHEADVLVYADIHEVLYLDVAGRPLINCGSVGNPLDSVLPSYLILEFEEKSPAYTVQFIRVPYNHEAEISVAEKSDMPFIQEYVTELQTGQYQKRRKKALKNF